MKSKKILEDAIMLFPVAIDSIIHYEQLMLGIL